MNRPHSWHSPIPRLAERLRAAFDVTIPSRRGQAAAESRQMLMWRFVLALTCAALAFGGCATPLGTTETAPSVSSATGAPTPLPADAFASEPHHDFGSNGP